jgi:N-acetyl-alpha-D-muramate 1-phosphate uridylyltransferase
MRGMILAAGRGTRMRELTAKTPKPLLRVGKHYLIEYAIQRFKQAGIFEIVINIAYLAAQIKAALGSGERYGVNILYSEETEPLEAGGGLVTALPLLGDEPFICTSADVITDFPLQKFHAPTNALAHLMMVDNPHFLPAGDFGLREGMIDLDAKPTLTFGNVGIYDPTIFKGLPAGKVIQWAEIMMPHIKKHQISGEKYRGIWYNIGTPEDLAEANAAFGNLKA